MFVDSLDFLALGDEFDLRGRLYRCLAGEYHLAHHLPNAMIKDNRVRLRNWIILRHNFMERVFGSLSPNVDLH